MRLYQFSGTVDIPAALRPLEVDSITVHEERLLVIFQKAVLDITVSAGTITTAERVRIEAVDAPRRKNADTGSLLERFLDQLETTLEIDWTEIRNRTQS